MSNFIPAVLIHLLIYNYVLSCDVKDTRQSSFSAVLSKTDTSEKMVDVDYNKVLEAQKDGKILIIDVREDSEIQDTGKLPGSIHIPMKEVLNELNLSSEKFENKYGKKQPLLDTQIIVSCRSGKRSKVIQADLQSAGYTNVSNYLGGWLDWEQHQRH